MSTEQLTSLRSPDPSRVGRLRLATLAIGLLLLVPSFCARTLPDSLRSDILLSADTSLVLAYSRASAYFRFSDNELATAYMDSAEMHLPDPDPALHRERLLADKGILLSMAGDQDGALAAFRTALTVFEANDRLELAGTCVSNLSSVHRLIGNVDSSYLYLLESTYISKALGDRDLLATDYLNMAGLFLDAGENDRAESYLKKFLTLEPYVEDMQALAIGYQQLGMVKEERDEEEGALFYFHKALARAKQCDDQRTRWMVEAQIIEVLAGELGIAEIRARMDKALSGIRRVGVEHMEGAILDKYGRLESEYGDVKKAESLFSSALAILDNGQNEIKVVHTYLGQSENEEKNGDLDLAQENAVKAYELALQLDIPITEMEALDRIGALQGLQGEVDAKEKTDSMLKSKSLEVQSLNSELLTSLEEVEKKEEMRSRPGSTPQVSEERIGSQRIWSFILLGVILILAGLGYRRFLKQRARSHH